MSGEVKMVEGGAEVRTSIDELRARWVRTGDARDLMAWSDAVGAETKKLREKAAA